jgi:radical SAM protein with 4Fe4S-binding SPASM domain
MQFSELQLVLNKLTFRRLINALKIYVSYYFSYIFKTTKRRGYPLSISIEPTTDCNLKCPQCPTGRDELNRVKGTINHHLYVKIIDEFAPYVMNLILYFQGEPFLNKDIFKLIKYASIEKNVFTVSSTNGHYLDEQNCIKIIQSGLDKLIISIDGTDQQTYSQYRSKGKLEKVLKGVETLVKKKNEIRSKTPFIELQFLVFRFNEHQITDMKRLSKQLHVNSLKIKTAQIYDFENNTDLIPSIQKYARYKKDSTGNYVIKNKLKNRCKRMWESAVIAHTGEVLHCCFDKDAKFSYGSLSLNTFSHLNNSVKAKDFRKQILKDRRLTEICKNCTEGLYK